MTLTSKDVFTTILQRYVLSLGGEHDRSLSHGPGVRPRYFDLRILKTTGGRDPGPNVYDWSTTTLKLVWSGGDSSTTPVVYPEDSRWWRLAPESGDLAPPITHFPDELRIASVFPTVWVLSHLETLPKPSLSSVPPCVVRCVGPSFTHLPSFVRSERGPETPRGQSPKITDLGKSSVSCSHGTPQSEISSRRTWCLDP